MATIGTLAYQVVADTHKFAQGMVATRAEIRQARQVFLDSRSPAEKFGMAVEALDKKFRQGLLDADTYARHMTILKAELSQLDGSAEAARVKQAALTREQQRAAQVQQQLAQRGRALYTSLRTPLEQLTAKTRDYQRLLRAGAINQDTFNRAIAKAKSDYVGTTAATQDQVDVLGQLSGRYPLLGAVVNPATGAVVAFGAAVAATNRIVRDVIETGATFQFSMSRVKALSRATEEEFKRLELQARELGAATSFTATQAAEGMQFFSLAGFKVNEIYDAMPATLDLAAAGQIQVSEAADIAAKTMRALNIEAAQFGNVADLMAQAMTNSNTDMLMMGEAMKFVAPIAATLNKGIVETTAAIMELSDAGLQGELAGTALRQSLIKLAKPSDEGAKMLQKLRISVLDVDGTMRPLPDLIDDFNRALDGMGSGERLAVLSQILEARAATGFAVLLKEGGDAMRERMELLAKSGGRASEIAVMQLDNVKGSWVELTSAIEGTKITAFDKFASDLQFITDGLTFTVQKVNVVGEALGGAAAASLPFVGTINTLREAYESFTGSVDENTAAMRDNPLANSELGKKAGDVIDPLAAQDAETAQQESSSAADAAAKAEEDRWKAIESITKDAAKAVNEFGQTEAEIIDNRLKDLGASDALRSQVREWYHLRDAMQAVADGEEERRRKREEERREHDQQLRDLERFGKDVFERTRTPLEQYTAAVNKLDEALAATVIDQETYNRAIDEERDKLEAATDAEERAAEKSKKLERQQRGVGTVGTVGAVQRGTAEAFSIVNRSQQSQELRVMTGVMRQELMESKKQTNELAGIRRAAESAEKVDTIENLV